MVLRVTQYFVEVLGDADAGTEHLESATETLSISESGTVAAEFARSVTETLTISADDAGQLYEESVDEILSIDADLADADLSIRETVFETLAIVDDAGTPAHEKALSVTELLISIVDTVVNFGTQRVSAATVLSISESATKTMVRSVSASTLLSFSEVAGQWHDASASTFVSIADDGYQVYTVEEVLSIVDTANGGSVRIAETVLSIEDSASQIRDAVRSLQEDLSIVVSAYGYIDREPCPAFTVRDTVLLQLDATTITLPRPEFGNSESLEFDRISRRSRGGTSIVYADPSWNRNVVFSMTFRVKEDTKDLLKAFLDSSLGQPITLVDHEDVTWNDVLIRNPDAEITQERDCDFVITLEFEA